MAKTYGIGGVGTKGSYNLDKTHVELSTNHLRDTVEYDFKHAEEHLIKAREACERLEKAGTEAPVPKSLVDLFNYFQNKDSSESKVRKIAGKVLNVK